MRVNGTKRAVETRRVKICNMPPGQGAMETARRVLTAIAGHRAPNSADVEALRMFDDTCGDRGIDELAYYVMEKVLKERAALKKGKDA